MAEFIQIRKQDMDITSLGSDFLLGINSISLIKQGNSSGGQMLGYFTIFLDSGKFIQFKVSNTSVAAQSAAKWTHAIIQASIGNPGYYRTTVLPKFTEGLAPSKITEVTLG